MTVAIIKLEFQAYWVSGTGAGHGRGGDVRAHRDAEGFPAMPMSQVKGTLREAAERLVGSGTGGWTDILVKKIFGVPEKEFADRSPEGDTRGAVSFSGEARLNDQDAREWESKKPELFRRISSTSVSETGAAADRTLRHVEACVPLTLYGRLPLVNGAPVPDWITLLDTAAAAMPALGKQKNDGFGRVIASVGTTQ